MTHLEIFHLGRKEATLFKELAYARSAVLRRDIFKRYIRQIERRQFGSSLRLLPKQRPIRTPGDLRKGIHKPRVRICNLFNRHYKKLATRNRIGERSVRAAPFNAQFLHQGIEAMVRHILVGNAGNRQGIPHRMILKRNADLGKSLLQELGIKHGVVRHNRQVTNESINLLSHGRKGFRIFQVSVANARKAFDKGAERYTRRLHQIIDRFTFDAVFKAYQRHLDDFVLFKIEARCFQVNCNK